MSVDLQQLSVFANWIIKNIRFKFTKTVVKHFKALLSTVSLISLDKRSFDWQIQWKRPIHKVVLFRGSLISWNKDYTITIRKYNEKEPIAIRELRFKKQRLQNSSWQTRSFKSGKQMTFFIDTYRPVRHLPDSFRAIAEFCNQSQTIPLSNIRSKILYTLLTYLENSLSSPDIPSAVLSALPIFIRKFSLFFRIQAPNFSILRIWLDQANPERNVPSLVVITETIHHRPNAQNPNIQ